MIHVVWARVLSRPIPVFIRLRWTPLCLLCSNEILTSHLDGEGGVVLGGRGRAENTVT
jgi:hypothetical protein